MTKLICIDPGHGNKKTSKAGSKADPGAVNGKFFESVAALSIAKKLGAMLTLGGYKVIYTRTNEEFKTLSERCIISNNAKSDLFISIHLNASTNKEAQGFETWVYEKCGADANAISWNMNVNIKNENLKTRGTHKTNNLYVLKHTKAPAVLVETGFISNDEECKMLFNDKYQMQVVWCIYKAISKVI